MTAVTEQEDVLCGATYTFLPNGGIHCGTFFFVPSNIPYIPRQGAYVRHLLIVTLYSRSSSHLTPPFPSSSVFFFRLLSSTSLLPFSSCLPLFFLLSSFLPSCLLLFLFYLTSSSTVRRRLTVESFTQILST